MLNESYLTKLVKKAYKEKVIIYAKSDSTYWISDGTFMALAGETAISDRKMFSMLPNTGKEFWYQYSNLNIKEGAASQRILETVEAECNLEVSATSWYYSTGDKMLRALVNAQGEAWYYDSKYLDIWTDKNGDITGYFLYIQPGNRMPMLAIKDRGEVIGVVAACDKGVVKQQPPRM